MAGLFICRFSDEENGFAGRENGRKSKVVFAGVKGRGFV
jgi:hypothetical protein